STRPRGGWSHRCVDAWEAPRAGTRGCALPRDALPEPLRRHEDRPHPLRRARDRRGPDHGGWDDRAPLRRAGLPAADHNARRPRVSGRPSLLLLIGSVGELGYELHFPSPYGEYLWDTLLERGADLDIRPFGLEPQRILRLEKMHILVGQDTDSESNVLEAGMPWIAKLDKDDFVGKWALEHVQGRAFREQLVGFEMTDGVVPAEGGQIVLGGLSAGRVTSARLSPQLGRAIGMAWVR